MWILAAPNSTRGAERCEGKSMSPSRIGGQMGLLMKQVGSHFSTKTMGTSLGITVIVMFASCAEPGVFDHSAGVLSNWADECRIHRPCKNAARLPICREEKNTDSVRMVTGRVRFRRGECTLVGCNDEHRWHHHCCNKCADYVILEGEDGTEFELPGLDCAGDESRVCCRIAVSEGQRIRASYRDGIHLCAL